MAELGRWFIHLHAWLHWWGPAILALYSGIAPWVLFHPQRYTEVVSYNSNALLSENETFSIFYKYTFFSLPVWYCLWFALPHEGVEILLLIVFSPFFAMYLLFTVVMWALDMYTAPDFGPDSKKRKAMGMTLAEWKIMQYRQKQAEEQARMRAFEEREASFRGEDIRKDRFRVYDGTGGARE